MRSKGYWVSLAILNLCAVALLGVILRSKILFELPSLDYNHLLNVHSHFAFGGWVTLALLVLMVYELLPETTMRRPIYQYLFWGTFFSAWGLIFTLPFAKYAGATSYFSAFAIFITYIFGWVFIKDIRKANVSKTTALLAISAVVCLVLSSIGPIALAYLFTVKSLNGILYRDALFSYLHLQYNGFFTLAVFALLFNRLGAKLPENVNKRVHRFSVLLVWSIIPSMFLSYHWHDPSLVFHVIAYIGSILLILSLAAFIAVFLSLAKVFKSVSRILKTAGIISIGSFMLKMLLQSFTIINQIGNPVFGDRPIIMGFLHLVFLGFVTLFLLSYFAQTGILNFRKSFTKFALIFFAIGIVLNLGLLFAQGIAAMFIQSNPNFVWLLWGAAIWMFIGAALIGISRILSIFVFYHDIQEEENWNFSFS